LLGLSVRNGLDSGHAATSRHVCVVANLRGPGLGDLIHRNLLVRLVQHALPGAHVALIVPTELRSRFKEFFDGHCSADEVLAADPPVARSDPFDVCVVDPDSVEGTFELVTAIGSRRRIGFAAAADRGRALTEPLAFPETKRSRPDLLDFARLYGRALGVDTVSAADLEPWLPFRRQRVPESDLPRPLVALHPGGGRHWNRRWPLERFAELGARATDISGATILVVGGDDERDEAGALVAQIARLRPHARVVDGAGAALNHLANQLAAADLFVGNDSAPMHVAAAVHTPVVAVHGPTGTEFLWHRLYRDHTTVSRRYECRRIVHAAGEHAREPCKFGCPQAFDPRRPRYPRCLLDVSVDEVWAAVAVIARGLTTSGK
jgi:ADP-heptose:LPS heptosyltransferase